ncbi:hypothetical protein C0J52_26228 [Blattella germanica]|nr:hypothetical protein C0J52_26228 [Blattella germanica]
MLPEISSTLTSLESCIALLLPTPENFFIQEECDITKDDKQNLTIHNDCKQFDEGNLIQSKSEDSLVVINDYSKIHDLDINSSENYKMIENSKFNSEATDSSDLEDEISSSKIHVLDIKPSTSKIIEDSELDNSKFDSETDSSDAEEKSFNFREYGIINATYSMEVNVNTGTPVIKETAENAAIFENAKDLFTLINNRYVPTVKKWIQVLTKSSGTSEDLKRIIHMKQMLEKAIQNYRQIKHYSILDYESSSSNSDFEEVEEKEGFEKEVYEDFSLLKTSIPTNSLKTQRVKSNWNIWSEENDEKAQMLVTRGVTK